jgi:transposase, IS5 family
MERQAGFFDVDERLQRLSDLGDQLEAYAATVDFEIFRSPLEAALAYADGLKGGRPAYDAVMMFKILVIQAQNNLSDERTEFLINDRLSFMRFLGLSLGERVPDAKTIWLFRERLTRAERDREAVRPLRSGRPRGRLYCHVGSDRGREPHRCAEAAQHRCREGGYQGWPHPAGLEQEPGKAPSEGPQRALDCEVLEG